MWKVFMDKKLKLLQGVFAVSAIIVILFFARYFKELSVQSLLDFTPESPALAALVFLGLYCLKAFVLFIPLTVLYLGAGVLFPVGWAFVLTYFCLIVESSIGFFLGRRLGRKRVRALLSHSERGRKLLDFSNNNSILSCFIIRMIPGPPIEVTNMFIGTTGIKFFPFIVGTLLGYTPGMIPFILFGGAMSQPLALKYLLPCALGIMAVFGLAGIYLWRHLRMHREPVLLEDSLEKEVTGETGKGLEG
ncbi:MAG TPA: TVP38/TMEM64 family protein [Firmicutes bacterium]|nr:TVP38/TMEM64 family protein [Bacillota bacterium]